MVDVSDLQLLRETLSEIESTAQYLEGKHKSLASGVNTQCQGANVNIIYDKKALTEQLRLTGHFISKTIEATKDIFSHQPLLSCFGYILLDDGTLTSKDTLTTACSSLISNFDELAKLAGEANERLNAIHRAALQKEDEIAVLAKELEDFDSEYADLEDLEEELADARAELRDIQKAQQNSQQNSQQELKECRWQQAAYEKERRHQTKKARWLWVAAPVTGGLTALPAMYASHSKRRTRRLHDAHRTQARNLESDIEEAKSFESDLSLYVEEHQAASSKLEIIKSSTARVTRENKTLAKLVEAKCEDYMSLKEESVKMASKTRNLQSRVEMLGYAEGAKEVQQVMWGLAEDLGEEGMGRLGGAEWYADGGERLKWLLGYGEGKDSLKAAAHIHG